jgi:hypothetical protein
VRTGSGARRGAWAVDAEGGLKLERSGTAMVSPVRSHTSDTTVGVDTGHTPASWAPAAESSAVCSRVVRQVDTGMPDGPRPGSDKPGSRIMRDERLSPALRSMPQLFE